jgi:hypothetical protein
MTTMTPHPHPPLTRLSFVSLSGSCDGFQSSLKVSERTRSFQVLSGWVQEAGVDGEWKW